MSPRALAPCGTAAAERRHRRRKEPIDEACRKAAVVEHQMREEERQQEAAAQAQTATITVDADTVTLELNVDEARMVAASVLDRSLALANAPKSQVGAPAAAQRTRALYKRMMSTLREAGVLS